MATPRSSLAYLGLPPARAAALAAVLLAFAGTASAQLYWDNNGGTAGFGTATGTWAAPTTNNSTQGWSSDSTGGTLPSGTTTTTTSDALNFGTGSAGLAAGTITVSGNVSANSLTFGSLSGNIVLSSGGNITLGGTTPTITVNNTNATISSVIVGTAGLTKNGTGTLTLSATNTFTGNLVINSGTVATSSTGLLADTANVTISSGATYTVGAADTIRSASGAGNVILNANLTFNPNVSNSAWASPKIQLSGNISGTGQITTQGLGYSNMTLSGNNSGWSGTLSLGAYTIVNLGSANATGTGTIDFQNGANEVYIMSSDTTDRIINNAMQKGSGGPYATTFGSATTGNLTFNGNLTWSFGRGYTLQVDNAWTLFNGAIKVTNNEGAAYSWSKNGNGTLILNGNNTFYSNTIINAGTLQIGASGRIGAGNYSSNITINGLSSALVYSGSNNQTLGGIISGNGSLTHNGTGTVTLTNTNTYTGATKINAGTLSIATITNGGVAGNLGNSTNAAGNLVLGGGSLLYTGANASTDRNFTLTASTTSVINVSNATTTLTISGTSASTNGALTKNGSGTLVLSGNNGHSGATTINGGTLVLSGTNTGSAVTINSGGSLISATSLGSTTVNDGGKIAPGTAAATVGSLTVAGLTLNSGGTFTWDMSNATGAAGTGWDRIVSSGLLTIGSTSGSQFTIAITSSGAPSNWDYTSSGQTWDIITYGSQSGFAANKFAFNTSAFFGSLTADSSWALSDTGTALRLTYTYAASSPTWNGASGNWSAGFNPAITNGANATFAGPGGTATNDIPSATLSSVGAMIFSGTGSYTLQANSGSAGFNTASALAVGGPITNSSTGTQTINLAMSFGANQTISATSGNIVIGGVISGAGALTKQGNNSLTLSGANTYSGGTTLVAGQLNINSATALGNGTLTLTSGTLDNTSGSSITLSNNNVQNWNGDVTFTGSNNLNLGAGAVAMSDNRTVTTTAGTLTVGGVVSGVGFGITKNGSGTLTLAGNNTYTGVTTVNGGTLQVGGAGLLGGGSYSGNIAINGLTTSFLYNGTNNQTLSGIISGNGSLTKNNTGTLTISGANTYTGGVTVNGGTLIVSGGGNDAIKGAVTINTGATLTASGGNVMFNAMTSLTIDGGTLNVTNAMGQGGYTGTFNNATITGGGWFNMGTITLTGTNVWTMAQEASWNTGTLIVDSGTTTIPGFVNNRGNNIIKNGAGTLVVSGNSSITGNFTMNNGTLAINAAQALGTSTCIFTITGGTLDNTSGANLTLTANNTQSWNGDFTFNGTKDLNMGTGAVTMNASRTVTVNAGNFTVGGNITGSTFGLTKNGSGTLVLSGANTYNGTTTVNNGTITLGAADRIADTSNLNVAGGTFNLGGFNETLGSITGSGNITLGAGTLTTNSSSSTTFSGLISGSGGLTKAGTGTLTLSGNSSYNGTTTLNAGTVVIGHANGLGTTGNITFSGGALQYGSGITQDLSSRIKNSGSAILVDTNSNNVTFASAVDSTNSGGLTKNGTGTLTLNATNTYTGTTTINGGTLQIASAGLLGSGNYSANIVNNGALIFGSNSNQTLSGAISGSGALTKNGSGSLTLAGNSNYSGNTTINTGTVVIGNANAAGTGRIVQADGTSLLKIDTTGTISNNMSVYNVLASQSATLSGAITVNNATFEVDPGDNLTISGSISGAGGVTKNGNGTLTLSGNNTYASATVINAGTLNAASTGALGSNNTVQVNGGTLLVSADDAINGMSITLNGTSATVPTLSFNSNYNGTIGTLTLSSNSIIDMGNYNIGADFADLVMGLTNTLKIYNWSGTTLWNGGNGNNPDQIYFNRGLSESELGRISFYSDFGYSFLGSGFQIMSGGFANEIIPVPEPETWATGILLVLGGGLWLWRKRRNFSTEFTETTEKEGRASAPIEKMVGLFRRNDPNQRQSRPRALPANSTTI